MPLTIRIVSYSGLRVADDLPEGSLVFTSSALLTPNQREVLDRCNALSGRRLVGDPRSGKSRVEIMRRFGPSFWTLDELPDGKLVILRTETVSFVGETAALEGDHAIHEAVLMQLMAHLPVTAITALEPPASPIASVLTLGEWSVGPPDALPFARKVLRWAAIEAARLDLTYDGTSWRLWRIDDGPLAILPTRASLGSAAVQAQLMDALRDWEG